MVTRKAYKTCTLSPLKSRPIVRDGLPLVGGGRGEQGTVSPLGGGLQGYFKANCGTLH